MRKLISILLLIVLFVFVTNSQVDARRNDRWDNDRESTPTPTPSPTSRSNNFDNRDDDHRDNRNNRNNRHNRNRNYHYDGDGCEDDPTPSPTSMPSSTPTVSPTPSLAPTIIPTATPVEPTPTSVPTQNPDVCPNIVGIQTSLPDEYHFDNAGVNCLKFELGGPSQPSGIGGANVLGTSTVSTSQVLGASTMAGTGVVEDSIFYSLFSIGSLLTSVGIMRNGKKK